MLFILTILLAPGAIIYPQSNPHLRFDHSTHLAQQIPCDTCHQGVTQSVRSSDEHRPAEAICGKCHSLIGDKDPASTCEQCHLNYEPDLPDGATRTRQARNWPSKPSPREPRLVFSHRLHHERGVPCATCHITKPNQKTMGMPTMRQCMDCHEKKGTTNRCGACHVEQADGHLKTRFQGQRLIPETTNHGGMAHIGNFATHHGDAARSNPDECKTCHTEPECSRCHSGQIRPLELHPADYIHQHSGDALRDPAACGQCHRQQTFCVSCHSRGGISPRDDGFGFGARTGGERFHPPGFAGGLGQAIGPEHHGFAARRSMGSCVGCHQENDCVRCHSTGAPSSLRASPHPAGFICGEILRSNPRSCLKCHTDLQQLESICR